MAERTSAEVIWKWVLFGLVAVSVASFAIAFTLGINVWVALTNASPILLALATIAVALFTRELSRITDKLARIEMQRDGARADEAKVARLREKLRLAELLISWTPEAYGGGGWMQSGPRESGDYYLQQLGVLIDPRRETDLWNEIHGLLGVLDKTHARQLQLDELAYRNFIDSFERIKVSLLKRMPEWRRDVALMLAGWVLPPEPES